ncbi:MAG: choice-of-anchor D domain-containing protein, partial [Candidatus Acidiferrales bacterium]
MILSAAIVFPLLFAFGTPARGNIAVRPRAVVFSNQTVGTTSAAMTVTLTNDNRRNMTISQVSSSSAQFSLSAPALPVTLSPRQSLVVTVQFSPVAARSYTSTLVFTRENRMTISIPLSGAGVPAAAATTTLPPTITSQPLSRTVIAGQTASFSVAATGTSPMTYQWRKNGASISGATASSYTTPAETTADNNTQFTVAVSNSAGNTASNPAILTVNAAAIAPTITSQPVSQKVNAGQPATFNVAVTGTSPFTYQWSKNGTPISGATSSSYTTPPETTADNNAQFAVAVSNSAGKATSNAAMLTVNASTLVLSSSSSSLNFGNVNVSSSSSQNVTLTNTGT